MKTQDCKTQDARREAGDGLWRKLAVVVVGCLAVWLLVGCSYTSTAHGTHFSLGTDLANTKVDLAAGVIDVGTQNQSVAMIETTKEARNLGLGYFTSDVWKSQSSDAASVDKAKVSGQTARARSADGVEATRIRETQRTAREALHAAP